MVSPAEIILTSLRTLVVSLNNYINLILMLPHALFQNLRSYPLDWIPQTRTLHTLTRTQIRLATTTTTRTLRQDSLMPCYPEHLDTSTPFSTRYLATEPLPPISNQQQQQPQQQQPPPLSSQTLNNTIHRRTITILTI